MKRLALILAFVASAAYAAGQTIEMSEAEIARLQRAIVAMRKEQCT